MSRVGNKPIPLPAGVKVAVHDGVIDVEGPKAKLSKALPPLTAAQVVDNAIIVSRADESTRAKAMHGLARSLINGMVIGVTEGFRKQLEIIGVGYRAQAAGQQVTLSLGYSHPIIYTVHPGVKVTVADNTKVTIEGADKQLVGEAAASMRRFRKPEPYKGKGVRYLGEHVVMKEGKTVG
jgi:large subunit ribosomal protein L6